VVAFPQSSTAQAGWAQLPLLQLRAAVVLAPATGDTVEPIDTPDRARLVRALDDAVLTDRLRSLAARCTPASAAINPAPVVQAPLDGWHVPEDSHQTTLWATYRLGSEQTAGIGAIVNVRMPDPLHGAGVTILVDVAVSVTDPLSFADTAVLLRDAVLAGAVDVSDALGELLPAESAVTRVECHLDAASNDGTGLHRPNSIEQRLAWPWPRPANRPLTTLRVAAEVSGPLSAPDAAHLIERGLRLMVLDAGVLEPDQMIEQIHQALRAV